MPLHPARCLGLLRPPFVMAESSFFEDSAKSETRKAVADIEAQTSAEIVVALRRTAGSYRAADYLVGFVLAVVALLVMLFTEHEFRLLAFPGGVIAAFVFGAFASASIPPLRRTFTLPSRRRDEVRRAARAAFVDLGVSRTRARTGVLVFVALFEREVEIVADIGVDPEILGEEWTKAVLALRDSQKPQPSFARFVERLRALAAPLAAALPRAKDDVNELPDEVAE